MRFWTPGPDEPLLLEWWLPLMRAARRALVEQVHWLIVPDEWQLCGRFLRKGGRPDVWVYLHHRSNGELRVDDSGQPYRFVPNTSGPSRGRFVEIGIRAAVWQCGLPDVGVAVWWDQPPPAWHHHEYVSENPIEQGEPPRRRPPLHLVR